MKHAYKTPYGYICHDGYWGINPASQKWQLYATEEEFLECYKENGKEEK